MTLAADRDRREAGRALGARLPELIVAARRIAASVVLGVHGRRRAGPGETFWQFRAYTPNEPARLIDWRRSARDDRLYVREREWEAAQTVWLWADLSPSMDFRSKLADTTKLDRAAVLLFALADLLGRGGERVGLPGRVEPRIGRDMVERFAEALARDSGASDWPDLSRIRRHADVVVISDFLMPPDLLERRLRALAGHGVRLHLLQVMDPAEETFPYDGRLEFRDPETGRTWLAERAGGLRAGYRERLAAHRGLITEISARSGFSFAVHHTDQSAAQGLLSLYARLAAPPGAAGTAA